ncbi:hypothetical protein RQP46_006706 [Phenoliferia psychrophenolica]
MPAFSQRRAGLGAVVNADDVDASLQSRSLDASDDKNFGTEKGDGAAHILSEEQVKEVVVVNDGTPFPEDPNMEVETRQLTFRALLVGCILGFVVGASNIYLGLKTLFGSILSFAILKPLSHTNIPLFRGYYGPKENVVAQSAATAAGGLSGLFAAAVPAMYQLNLLSLPISKGGPGVSADIGKLIALSFFTAYYGAAFAIPLRKYYILKQKLIFPSPTASAFTIRSLHSVATPAARLASAAKVRVILYSFAVSLTFCVLNKYAPGILLDWHFGWLFGSWGHFNNHAIELENYGWIFEWTPAFIAVGFLTGPSVAGSWLSGSFLSWAIIAPILVKTGEVYSPYVDRTIGYRSNYSMTSIDVDGVIVPRHGSARYWLLYPGVLTMIVHSFAEISLQGPVFYRQFRTLFWEARRTLAARQGKDISDMPQGVPEGQPDPAPKEEQVQTWAWVGILLASGIFTMVLAKTEFNENPGTTLLALFLGFFFGFVGIQVSGVTDINPIGLVAKAGQLIIGGVTKAQGIAIGKQQLTSLVGGSIVGQSASHAVDMVGDLKTGHLLSASPRAQFWAQQAGATAGFAFSAGLFVIFAQAYPCITDIDVDAASCPFGLPAVAVRLSESVAVAVTSPKIPIAPSSAWACLILSIITVFTVVLKHYLPANKKVWVPNMSAVGLAMVVPQTYYPIAVTVGAAIAYGWQRRSPTSWEIYGFALSAGMIAGEGIAGVITAILVIAGVDGSVYGSAVGCPLNSYCG